MLSILLLPVSIVSLSLPSTDHGFHSGAPSARSVFGSRLLTNEVQYALVCSMAAALGASLPLYDAGGLPSVFMAPHTAYMFTTCQAP